METTFMGISGEKEQSIHEEAQRHFCKSITEAFVYDQYRKCTGEFKFIHIFKYIYYSIVQPAYCAILLFRIQQYLYSKAQKHKERQAIKLFNKILFRFYDLTEKITARLNFTLNGGFEANHNADVQPGLFIHHPQGIIIGGNSKIGANCHLFKNVLFGEKNGFYPVIKDNVVLYANSVILGGITLHDNAVVGPNSVVIHDVADSAIVAGIPAKPIGVNEYHFIPKDGIPLWVRRSGR